MISWLFQISKVLSKDKILHLCHCSPYAGHVGRNKTYDLVARSYWWPGVHKDVGLYCRSCDFCQRVYTQQPKGSWFISASPIAKETMEYSHYGSGYTVASYSSW